MEQNNKPENPRVYPCTEVEDTTNAGSTFKTQRTTYHKGMTLRDHYAGMAMQALITYRLKEQKTLLNNGIRMKDVVAKEAYEIADAMLTERQKEK